MQRCPEPGCGHLNRPSARFCERCGRPLRSGPWSPLRTGHVMRGGGYRILEPLGAGGMGALYLAADTGAFDRKCVIKELLDYYDPTDAEEARKAQARFETEARLLAELSHPGIPRIYSYFSELGRHYIVMEYIEGETLLQAVTHTRPQGQTVPARPLAAEEVVRHAIRVCKVLEYLSGQPTPVIHHDIKPANLIVDRTSGEVRLVDFGTAQSRTPWATQTRLQRGATSAFGTEGYAAPEQFRGQSEPRSDVYALAATMYHLLTDDDPAEHPFQFPKLPTLANGLSDALARGLRPEARRRSTALEFRQALEAWLIPEDGARPFVFRDRAVAYTTADLAALSDKRWPEARQHLADGDFDGWFRARNRFDLVARSKAARSQPDVNAALEEFLRHLNPRLPPPHLVVEPPKLGFGRVSRPRVCVRRLVVRNEGRGYGQATFRASVPWIDFDPPQVGCLEGEQAAVNVRLDAAALPLQRDHQAVIACTTARGVRISIPVEAELSVALEVAHRVASSLAEFGRLIGRGACWGVGFWIRTLGSLLRLRLGPWLLLAELLVLSGGLVGLWWSLRNLPVDPLRLAAGFLQALPVALLAVYLLPAIVFAAVGVVREAVRALLTRNA